MRTFNFVAFLAILVAHPINALADWHVYVAANASARGDGSSAKPFSTLIEARDAIRAARKSNRFDGAITVHVRSGVYRLESTLEFNSDDSGTHITWRSRTARWRTSRQAALSLNRSVNRSGRDNRLGITA